MRAAECDDRADELVHPAQKAEWRLMNEEWRVAAEQDLEETSQIQA